MCRRDSGLPSVISTLLLLCSVSRCLASEAVDIVSLKTSAGDLWTQLATKAAKETLKAVKANAGLDLTLSDVPLDTLQLYVGRQHQLGIEVEGKVYEVSLGGEADLRQHARALPAANAGPTPPSAPAVSSTSLVPQDWWKAQHSTPALPEITLAGPLELMLPEPALVGVFTPHAVDVGRVRRVTLAAGANVRLSGARALSLRHPLDLPPLPGQYLAEVYAGVHLGEEEEGFEHAPGLSYLTAQLRARAINASLPTAPAPAKSRRSSSSAQSSSTPPSPVYVVSLLVEPVAPGSLTLITAPQVAAEAVAPRLKARRTLDGTLELSVRPGEVVPAAGPSALSLVALSHLWAWPLPHTPLAAWLPYESVLRSVLAVHPFVVEAVVERGIGVRLTKSSVRGVNLVAFEMQVVGHAERPTELQDSVFEWNTQPTEVWEAVVKVQSGPSGEWTFMPLHARRKATHHNTLTVARNGLDLMLGNTTTPMGYERDDAFV